MKVNIILSKWKSIYFCFIDYAEAFDYVDHKKLWKTLRESYLPPEKCVCRWRRYRIGHGCKLGKEYVKAVYSYPVYLTYMQSISDKMPDIRHLLYLDETQAGIKFSGRNINNLRYAEDTILMENKRRGSKELLDEGERREWKRWLKTQHSKN